MSSQENKELFVKPVRLIDYWVTQCASVLRLPHPIEAEDGPVFISRNINFPKGWDECSANYGYKIYMVDQIVKDDCLNGRLGRISYFGLRPTQKCLEGLGSHWEAVIEPKGKKCLMGDDPRKYTAEAVAVIKMRAFCSCNQYEELTEGLVTYDERTSSLIPVCRRSNHISREQIRRNANNTRPLYEFIVGSNGYVDFFDLEPNFM